MTAAAAAAAVAAVVGAGFVLCSEAEEGLRAAVRALLAAGCDPVVVITRTEAAGGPCDPALWMVLARGIGAAGLLVPEGLDGAGATHRARRWCWWGCLSEWVVVSACLG
ncbi:hypothetical protein [Streptomyces boninensis]|uniref:hypothetical protein n=1 Tax=Streptomyces boninensis TaxID=2039455 RepID=UPI003B219FA5